MFVSRQRLDFLSNHQNPDGGWGYFPGRESRVEPTVYALRALGAQQAAWKPGIEFLLARQDASGGLCPSPSVPGATWVSQLAFPVLVQAGVERSKLEAAATWIADTQGAEGGIMQKILRSMGKSKVDQDPRLKGWPWRPGNNSWVEPTAHGLLALEWMKGYAVEAAIRHRRDLATRMLLDRRCLDFGWNYGNKRVLGETLPAYPETTGLALLGLAASQTDLTESLEKARMDFESCQGAYGRALLALALKLHGQSVNFELSEAPHASRNLMLAGIEVLALRGQRQDFLP